MFDKVILTTEEIKKLDTACVNLTKEDKVRHVGVINALGHLVAGGFKKGLKPMLEDEKVRMTYMQMQLDFKMRQELDEILGPIDYIASIDAAKQSLSTLNANANEFATINKNLIELMPSMI